MVRSSRLRGLAVVDAHAGGDVGRVILDGIDLPPGTVAERAQFLSEHADRLRRLLISSPHGDPSQCLNVVVEPALQGADAGLIITGTMGYPNFSGSNAMCTVAALADSGLLPLDDGEHSLALETPGGVSPLRIAVKNGEIMTVTYDALPGYVSPTGARVDLPGYGTIAYDVAYGGTYYAVVTQEETGLDPAETPATDMAAFFAALLDRVAPTLDLRHPELGPMPAITLGLLVGHTETTAADPSRVHVAVYMHPGVICRGPTGTGTTALIAWLRSGGQITDGQAIRTVSPYGNEFTGTLVGTVPVGEVTGVATQVSGRPRLLSRGEILIDLDDPVVDARGLESLLRPSSRS